MLAGSLRVLIEFVRVNLRVLGPLTLAQLISLTVVLAGVVMLMTAPKRPARV